MVNQEKQYYRIDPGYIVDKPWYNSYLDYQNHNNVPPSNPNPNYPAGVSPGQYAMSQKVYSLNGSTNRTGLEMVIKVMAGDKVDIFGRSYRLQVTIHKKTVGEPKLGIPTLLNRVVE